MANSKNLKTPSTSEARERGKKGGIKSGQKRRERKALKELLEIALTLDDEDTGEINQIAITSALIEQAKKGNVNAYITIRDTLGEKPAEKQEIMNTTPQVVVASESTKNKIERLMNMNADNNKNI